MKRALRVSSRTLSRRRRAQRRGAGVLLTFSPISEIDSAVLYTDGSGEVRVYPDAMPGSNETREVSALVPV
jgi:hypothetical protein